MAHARLTRKQAKATRVVRWDVDEDGGARLEVSDNGKGFDPAHVAGDHYGIVGMRERAEAVGARLRIVSRDGLGSSVVVEIESAAVPRRHVRRSA